ncbi:carbohydrate-binding protein [Paenibacillus guangzhouensis]|uniref:carbohydrate-binding protein n=1 Tax=Paenibacillus guangzhouensis TaxID=1473112 RepID=UPI001266E0AF|nr:carbohydrate-binding protein [Paenibacillus guangzhouensis]
MKNKVLKNATGILLSVALLVPSYAIFKPNIASAAGETVSVWRTNETLTEKLAQQSNIVFSPDVNSSQNTIYVDENVTFQFVDGFGASITDSSAYLMNQKLNASTRNALMTNLFSPTNGIGISWLRQTIGASDFSHIGNYNYKDSPTAPFSIAQDEVDIIPLLQQARNLNPNLKVVASPWSPPGWMKENGSMLGGETATLKAAHYGDLANYFVNFIDAYAAKGVPIYAVTPQNEPRWASTGYPGMYLTPQEEANFVKNNLGPALSGKNVKIFAFDHNWDVDFVPAYYNDTAAANYTSATAWHCYGGEATIMSTMHYLYPNKDTYETECTGGIWTDTTTGQFDVDMKNLTKTIRHWSKNFIAWNIALDTNHGPTNGGCTTCTGLVEINQSNGNVTYGPSYYSMGHLSKFVNPGAVRIASTGYANGIHNVALKNADGSKVLVVYNETTANNVFKVKWGNQSFSYSLPPKSAVTFKWSGQQSTANTIIPNTYALKASAYHEAFSIKPETSGDVGGGLDIGHASNGSWIMFKNVDLAGVTGINVRVANGSSTSTTMEVRSGSPTGTLLGTVPVEGTGSWQTWTTKSEALSGATGVQDIYLVYKGSFNLNGIEFTTSNMTPNLLLNEGFEAGNAASWNDWHPSGQAPAYAVDNDTPRTGTYKLTHYASSAYQQTTYQAVSVPNGTYKASVWVRSSGGQNALRLEASNYGGTTLYHDLGATSTPFTWVELVIDNINVTTGTITIGIHSNAQAGNWAAIDDFKLVKK